MRCQNSRGVSHPRLAGQQRLGGPADWFHRRRMGSIRQQRDLNESVAQLNPLDEAGRNDVLTRRGVLDRAQRRAQRVRGRYRHFLVKPLRSVPDISSGVSRRDMAYDVERANGLSARGRTKLKMPWNNNGPGPWGNPGGHQGGGQSGGGGQGGGSKGGDGDGQPPPHGPWGGGGDEPGGNRGGGGGGGRRGGPFGGGPFGPNGPMPDLD